MKTIRMLSWNVNGIRAVYKKGLLDWLAKEEPDILCIQETKAREEQLPAGAGAYAASGELAGSQSGLPVPRFVSLKSDRVNVRGGPSKDHEVVWVYARAGLPVEITAEFENWRRIRDWEGAEGWVYHSLLSGRRSAFVVKRKTSEELAPLYEPLAAAAIAGI